MATSADILADGFERVRESVHRAVAGLSADALNLRVDADANSIAWLVWHLTRVQDDHVAEVAGWEQVWTAGGWDDRFGLALPPADTGYGHGSAQVAAVKVDSPEPLIGYHDAVCERTLRYVGGLTDTDLGRVVDERWSPPVTLGVRLVSVIADDLQHSGQAAFVRGIAQRR
ncbi:MAG: DUF664 domain-containing protein [Streptosporangiales bacterium]|nr:DUF664 domain-containing protein [Streptosporangiales bacterium]